MSKSKKKIFDDIDFDVLEEEDLDFGDEDEDEAGSAAMETWSPGHLFRQVHIKMYNPPYTKLGFKAEDDPEQLRKRAHEALSAGAPGMFVEWVKENVQDWQDSHLCLHLMGQTLKVEGEAEEARECLTRALELRRTQGTPLQIASSLLGLSEVARFVDDVDEAWRLLDEAVAVFPHYRSAHLNRFCLASLAQDEDLLEQLYHDMCAMYPEWSTDEALCKGLKNDGELSFLRETKLWDTIRTRLPNHLGDTEG